MTAEIPRDHLDRILRSLWQRAPEPFFRLALGAPALVVHAILDSQIVLLRRGVDAVCEVEDERGRYIAHVEAETSASASALPARMWAYGAFLHASTGLPVRSSVLLLEPCPALEAGFELRHGRDLLATYHYQIVRLYEIPASQLASHPDLAVLTPLGAGATLEQVAQARDTLRLAHASPTRDDLLAALYVVGGRRFDLPLLARILTREQLMQSVTYQAILEEGIERGVERGVERGLGQGQERAQRATATRLLHLRFPQADLDQALSLAAVDQLPALIDQIATAPDAATLVRWVDSHLRG